jgi:hypothetical protein
MQQHQTIINGQRKCDTLTPEPETLKEHQTVMFKIDIYFIDGDLKT